MVVPGCPTQNSSTLPQYSDATLTVALKTCSRKLTVYRETEDTALLSLGNRVLKSNDIDIDVHRLLNSLFKASAGDFIHIVSTKNWGHLYAKP